MQWILRNFSFEVPMGRKCFLHNLKREFENIISLKYTIPKFENNYDKNWFYERANLSYFTFKNGQETEFMALWRQFVCLGLFTPCCWGEIQRLRKCEVILNRIVFANLSSSSVDDIMGKDEEDFEDL